MSTIDNNMYLLNAMSEQNSKYLTYFNRKLGRKPNLFLTVMYSNDALSAYYRFISRKTSLSKKELEAIALTVSQQNKAMYCLSIAHHR